MTSHQACCCCAQCKPRKPSRLHEAGTLSMYHKHQQSVDRSGWVAHTVQQEPWLQWCKLPLASICCSSVPLSCPGAGARFAIHTTLIWQPQPQGPQQPHHHLLHVLLPPAMVLLHCWQHVCCCGNTHTMNGVCTNYSQPSNPATADAPLAPLASWTALLHTLQHQEVNSWRVIRCNFVQLSSLELNAL